SISQHIGKNTVFNCYQLYSNYSRDESQVQ
ncbi:hypothetical protein AZ045_001888, partial [Enterobacter hormaechei]